MREWLTWSFPKSCPVCQSERVRFWHFQALVKHLVKFHKLHDDIALEIVEKLDKERG